MKVHLIFIVFIFSFLACQPEKPSNVLSEDDMAAWLLHVHTTEARLQGKGMTHDKAMEYFKYAMHEMKQQRKWNDSLITTSYQYYLAHPKVIEKLYDRMIDSLTVQEERLKQKVK